MGLLVSLLVPATGPANAQGPAKDEAPSARPPWQRPLGPQERAQAEVLNKQFSTAVRERDWASALQTAVQLAELRERVQGKDHWEVVDAQVLLRTLRQLMDGKPEDHQAYMQAVRKELQAKALEAKRQAREAQPLRGEVLETYHKILGDEHPYTARARNNLAVNQTSQGRFAEAEQGYRKALDVCPKALGEVHPQTAMTYSNLARNLAEQRRYAEAEPSYRKALDLYRRLLGEEHPTTARAYSGLAESQDAQGKYAEAEKGFRRALEVRRKLLGEEHPDTASAYSLLAFSQQHQGKYAEAEQGHRKALDLFHKALGEEHPQTATAYHLLATNQNAAGKYAEAEQGFRRALDIRRNLLGEDHPDTAPAYRDLADNQHAQGKYAEAETGYRKALDLYRKALGQEHPNTAAVHHALATNQYTAGKYAEAEQGFRLALDLFRKTLGEEHVSTAAAYRVLAHNQVAQGKYAEAEQGCRRALDILRKLHGEEHRHTAFGYDSLADSQQEQGKYAEAEQNFRKALLTLCKLLGEEHPDTAALYSHLALLHYDQGKHAEAGVGLRKALDIRRTTLGEQHPETGALYNYLAQAQAIQGKYVEAETGFRRALDITRKALGEEHPRTAGAYSNLAYNLNHLGKYAEAERLFARAADLARLARSHVAASGLERSLAARNPVWVGALPALLARNGKPEAAWQRYEETLGRGSKDELAARLRYSPADQARLQQLQVRLERLEQQLLPLLALGNPDPTQEQRRAALLGDKLQAQKDLLEHQRHLEQTYGTVAGQTETWQALQAALPADTALLGWVDLEGAPKATDPGGDHWALLLRSAGPPVCIRLPGSGPGQAWTTGDNLLPDRLRRALRDPQSDWRPLAQALRRQRMEPVAKHLAASGNLPAVRRLVVLPTYHLDGVPVEVLADGYAVSYALSGSYFAHQRRQPRPDSRGLLALGDPVFRAADALGLPLPAHGLLITWVAPNSNAAQAELRQGDILLRYGDAELRGKDDLAPRPPGDDPQARVPVRVWRLDQEGSVPAARTLDLTVRPGPLGITVANEPAPQALERRHRIEAESARRGGDWAELPGTRYEALRLADLFRQAQIPVTLLLDSEASEQKLDALNQSGGLGHVRYLHLATHGLSDARFQLRSRLLLSRDRLPDPARQLAAGLPPYDGELTAEEILRHWRLNADLVTLSACETARGREALSEGQVGFTQTLLLAGARSVVLSQWKVDDGATALLMERFYQNLLGRRAGLQKPLAKAEALDEARRWLRQLPRQEALRQLAALGAGASRGKDRPPLPRLPEPPRTAPGREDAPFAHPSYWAAFSLFGDPD
jgi:tetratricopeptide (TPR) repeat protein